MLFWKAAFVLTTKPNQKRNKYFPSRWGLISYRVLLVQETTLTLFRPEPAQSQYRLGEEGLGKVDYDLIFQQDLIYISNDALIVPGDSMAYG